jgi:hypothetical protein
MLLASSYFGMNHEVAFDQKNASRDGGCQCHDSWCDGRPCAAGKQSAIGIA